MHSRPVFAVGRIRQGIAIIHAGLADLSPDDLSGADAASLVAACADAERLLVATKARFARRAAETDAHRHAGYRTAADWLGAVSRAPVHQTKELLKTAERVASNPELDAAWTRGDLSVAQAKLIGETAALDRGATGELLDAATRSFADIRLAAEHVKHRVRGDDGERAREARAHAGRFCRVWRPDAGGMRLEAWLTIRDGSRLLARLDADATAIARDARAAGRREPHDRCRADTLVRLASRPRNDPFRDRQSAGGCNNGPDAHVVVRVDATALRRGAAVGDDVCEIRGLGPVPVATARELLGDCLLSILVIDGVDIRTVTSRRRTIPAALRTALAERDPTCVVPGCAVAYGLEIDHWHVDFADGGPTELANLARLCAAHHHLKTNAGWRLTGGPGRWDWVAPRRRARSPDP
jgi:hypothetical protein